MVLPTFKEGLPSSVTPLETLKHSQVHLLGDSQSCHVDSSRSGAAPGIPLIGVIRPEVSVCKCVDRYLAQSTCCLPVEMVMASLSIPMQAFIQLLHRARLIIPTVPSLSVWASSEHEDSRRGRQRP